MEYSEAINIMKRYNLLEEAEKEVKEKLIYNSHPSRLDIKFQIYKSHCEKKINEIYKLIDDLTEKNPEPCPYYEQEKQKNPYAHRSCGFLYKILSDNLHFECEFYMKHISSLQNSVNELKDACNCFVKESNYFSSNI